MNKWLHGLLALVAFFTFSVMSPLAFAEEKKEEKKDKDSKVVIFGEDKKDEKKDKDGK